MWLITFGNNSVFAVLRTASSYVSSNPVFSSVNLPFIFPALTRHKLMLCTEAFSNQNIFSGL